MHVLIRSRVQRALDQSGCSRQRLIGMQGGSGARAAVAKVVDLAAALDPAAQATQALALNLKLMRWRAAPALDLGAMARLHCIILGARPASCRRR
jgi:hypothetical protein